MQRMAFFLDTRSLSAVDLRDVDGGNPGIGGTEYMFFLIARYLSLKGRVAMYITRQGLFPDGIEYHVVGSLDEALDRFDENGESIVVLRESEVLPNIKRLGSIQQKILVWAHNYSGHKTLKACVRCPNIVRFICVSREQYENLRDEAIFSKAGYPTYIMYADAFDARVQSWEATEERFMEFLKVRRLV